MSGRPSGDGGTSAAAGQRQSSTVADTEDRKKKALGQFMGKSAVEKSLVETV